MTKTKKTSLTINYLMNVLLTMSNMIFHVVTFPYISRILQAEGIGKVELAISVIAYFTLFSQLGIPTYGIRACAAVREDRQALSRTVHELCFIQAVTTVISFAALFICIESVPKFEGERTLYWITGISVLLGAFGMEWLFKSLEQYRYITLRSVAFKAVALVAMFLFVKDPQDYLIYAAINVFASSGSYLLNLTQLSKYVELRPLGQYDVKKHLKPVFILFFYVCATTVYTHLDSVMLGFMRSDADVGYYNVSVKVKLMLVSVVTALGASLLPRASFYFKKQQMDEFWKIAYKALRVVLLMSVPFSAYFMIFAKPCVLFLAGEGYDEAILSMVAITPSIVCIGITSVTGVQILIPTNRENVVLLASVMGAVVDFVLNLILIPILGVTGAAIGTFSAELVGVLVHCYVLREDIVPIFKQINLWKIVLATLAACLSSFWVPRLGYGDFVTLAISAVIFFGVYGIFLCIAKDPDARYILKKIHLVK